MHSTLFLGVPMATLWEVVTVVRETVAYNDDVALFPIDNMIFLCIECVLNH